MTSLDIIALHLIGKQISIYKWTHRNYEDKASCYHLDEVNCYDPRYWKCEKILITMDSMECNHSESEGDFIYINFTLDGKKEYAQLRSVNTLIEIHQP